MTVAIMGLLPLIVFAIVDVFAGMRAAIIAAMVVASAEAAWSWYQFGEVDNVTWLSLGLIFVMGLVSIKMKDPRLFKFQPVVLAGVIAALLGWFQLRGQPLMVQMMPKVAALLPEEQRWVMSDPGTLERMARLDLMMIPTFIAHGAIVAWAALRKSTLFWLIARGAGIYLLMLLVVVINALMPMN
jgi:intracellular septation protein A